jgi:pyruvate,water dikinase
VTDSGYFNTSNFTNSVKENLISSFKRDDISPESGFSFLGSGEIGGKAKGLLFIRDILASNEEINSIKAISVSIPRLTVLTTSVFDEFMEMNKLHEIAYSHESDNIIANEFQKANLPASIVGDLRAIISDAHIPLAVRSSSLLEDAMYEPFAGIYGTKMIPNNQPDIDSRYHKLTEAIKFVFSSTFFKRAKDYITAVGKDIRDEKMAVIIQEVAGEKHGNHFYPDISGVGRSFNFYPSGKAKPSDGVVNLALGLGRTIVDDGVSWNFSPSHPTIQPPYANIGELIENTQHFFWSVNLGTNVIFDPTKETEYLLHLDISEAEKDGTLDLCASTYSAESETLKPGLFLSGARIVNFAPILKYNALPLNKLLKALLKTCQDEVKSAIEIELAITFKSNEAHLSFLQVRPMVISEEEVEITDKEMESKENLLSSSHVLGNGTVESIFDLVYIKPERFETKNSQLISAEVENINKKLTSEGKPFLLMGFGRWGSSDPWLGVPVDWGQISGAKVIVESMLPNINVELSQGSHFFHNITSFQVLYFSIPYNESSKIDWNWLNKVQAVEEKKFIKHVRLIKPLLIKVDGRTGRGVIKKMIEKSTSIDKILASLQERAKELNCIYRIEEILNQPNVEPSDVFAGIVKAIPPGWQYPDICVAKLSIENKVQTSENYADTKWMQEADIIVQGNITGTLRINYLSERPDLDEGPFLKEERRLINTIAERIGSYILHNKLKTVFKEWNESKEGIATGSPKDEWRIALDLLRETDKNLYQLIARKMINFLGWSGVKEAEALLHTSTKHQKSKDKEILEYENRPLEKENLVEISEQIFNIAADNLSDDEILYRIQKWIQEDKSSFLVRILENLGTTLPEIADAIRRYISISPEDKSLSPSIVKGLHVSLIRRFLSDQLQFISIAKNYVEINDFYSLLQKMIYPVKSHGKLGGKSVGLFIANKIIKQNEEYKELLSDIKIPKTWYITSDGIIEFLHYNNLEEVFEQKYKDIDQIRQEYPYIVQVFKNSSFPPELAKDLSLALDDFGNCPLIVRSSSLLEDRMGAAFSGKYKSLFVANQGTKQERLSSLMDAIAEVYASVFSSDPVEYRAERGLLDYNEEMGIMIQEVVGTRVGKYYFPTYAGVAFSNNEFRWSSRIKREDGLIRLVAGLGTRAVDRVSDDYPVLIAPGQPGLRVNVTVDEILRYSPKKIDVINLETNRFETVEFSDLLRLYGNDYPFITDIVSSVEHDQIKRIIHLDFDSNPNDIVITFDKLVNSTNFIKKLHAILNVLKDILKTPVDIEFASNGNDFYLLQCRPQSYSVESQPSPIPQDVPADKIIFTANKYVSNGKVPDITHIVYVDPEKYNELPDIEDLKAVGRAVGKLNKLLPKRQFILMGPGRWGSRGDIKLGVNVTYSDINNTAVLIEIARKKGNYLPDLSFGTHFFQDLVESSIRYLPMYPDDKGIIFNEKFLNKSYNILKDILPEYEYLSNVLKVIDIPQAADGHTMKVLMNADLDEAIAFISTPTTRREIEAGTIEKVDSKSEDFWRWRYRMAEKIACELDADRFGVKAFYVFGSTKNANAGPSSDIDIMIHFKGDDKQKTELLDWLEGWGLALGEMNYLKTGYKVENILDVKIITDTDIANKDSFAVKIGAITDAAKSLPMKKD